MSWHLSGRGRHRMRAEPERPHPAAQYVIDRLSENRPPPDADIATIRRHYNLSRRAFLTELEPIESVTHIVPEGAPRHSAVAAGRANRAHCLPSAQDVLQLLAGQAS